MYSFLSFPQYLLTDDEGVPRIVQDYRATSARTVALLLFNGRTVCIPFENLDGVIDCFQSDMYRLLSQANREQALNLLEDAVQRLCSIRPLNVINVPELPGPQLLPIHKELVYEIPSE